MICKNCGREIPDGSKFCSKCGSPVIAVKPEAKPVPSGGTQCENCGSELKPGSKFCIKCGHKVGEPLKQERDTEYLGAGRSEDETEILLPEEEKQRRAPRPAPMPAPYIPPYTPPVEKKKKKTGLIVAVALILFLAAFAAGICIYLFVLSGAKGAGLPFGSGKAGIVDELDEEEINGGEEAPGDKESAAQTAPSETMASETTKAVESTSGTTAYVWGSEAAATAPASETAPQFAETTGPVYGSTASSFSGYILPDSAGRYLTESDLSGLNKEQLRLARNEIYARHGRIFDAQDLSDYFSGQSWYNGTIKGADFNESVLNVYEKANLDLIKAAEAKLN